MQSGPPHFSHAAFRPSTIERSAKSVCQKLVLNPQQLVVLFRSAVRPFLTEVCTSTLGCYSNGPKSSVFRRHKMRRKKQPLTERLHFTWGQLRLFTSNRSPRNWAALTMRCLRASGAVGSSHRQPEMTHDVVWWSQSCQPASPKYREFAPKYKLACTTKHYLGFSRIQTCTNCSYAKKVRTKIFRSRLA